MSSALFGSESRVRVHTCWATGWRGSDRGEDRKRKRSTEGNRGGEGILGGHCSIADAKQVSVKSYRITRGKIVPDSLLCSRHIYVSDLTFVSLKNFQNMDTASKNKLL